ncbi:MAG TPA: aspartate aminotransferase family protein, partial [Trueperaceae bacterium]|nr:aspartate aminotransferase family protein [Trueperaceae bacterium]
AGIAKLAKKYNLWLHVDSAMAGSAMIIPELRWMWEGVEEADSIVLNPHKWLGAVFDISLFYVRDSEHLIRVMSTNPSYLQTANDDVVKNYRDWGIPLGRRFRALKLWFLLRSEGAEGLRKRLKRDISNAKWLAEQIKKRSDWELVAPVDLQTVCVRHIKQGFDGDRLEQHNQDWVAKINNSGKAYLTPAKIDNKWMVRISVGALPTERPDLEKLWQIMQDAVA